MGDLLEMKKVMFISSTGGHLTQLLQLKELFKENDKEKGRLAGSIKEKDEKDETSKEENKEN